MKAPDLIARNFLHVLFMKRLFTANGKRPVYCVIVFLVLGLCSCMGTAIKKRTENTYPVIQTLVVDTVRSAEFVADIYSLRNIEIRTRVHGFLEDILADEGQWVQEGQTIFKISDSEFREEVTKAEARQKAALAELEMAEVNLQNTSALVAKGVISKIELKTSEAKVAAARARVDEAMAQTASARLKLRYTEIKAPFSGNLNRIPYKKGSLLDEGALLTTLSDNRSVYAYFNVSEKDYLSYHRSKNETAPAHIFLILADNSLYPYAGRIETMESEIDKNTGTIAFRARFDNPHNLLRHGASGKIRMETRVNNALIIPQRSTFEIQDHLYVLVVDSANRVSRRRIKYSFRLPHLFVVAEGLKPGERIIYEGFQSLREGDQITPNYKDMRKVLQELKIRN